jgi:hypothetical protein
MKTLDLTKGEDREFTLKVRDASDDPIDISTADPVEVFFPGDSDEVALTLEDDELDVATPGKIVATLSAAKCAMIKDGLNQDMRVEYTLSSKKVVRVLKRVLNVVATEIDA